MGSFLSTIVARPPVANDSILFGLINLGGDDVVLPQNDDNEQERREELEETRKHYKWSHNVIGDTPMIEGVPKTELPSIGWINGIVRTIMRVQMNNLAVKYHDARTDLKAEAAKLMSKLAGLAAKVVQMIAMGRFDADGTRMVMDEGDGLMGETTEGKGSEIDEYRELFKVYKPDKVAYMDQFLRDDVFGWYRVAGPDPLHMRKVESVAEMFPELTDEIFCGVEHFDNDSIEEAASDGRLFYLDYKEYDGVPTGSLPDGTKKENFHLYAPTCLLAVPKEVTDPRVTILPIVIRPGQGSKYPMYSANKEHTDPVTWVAAKCTVQVADAVMLETRYHLGRTHLLLEIFICSMRRTLASNHPLLKFLSVHFEGTHFINYLGSLRLAAPGGTIDVISAPPIDVTTSLCSNAIRGDFSYNEWMPDREFANRGILDTKMNYPYRDDAMPIWEAIQEWVEAYVKAYYKSDADVKNDYELANWCKEITHDDMGAVPGFGDNESGKIETVSYLVRFVSSLVFIGSVQHAALNFPQGTLMQFVPAMPMAGFCPAPTTERPFRDINQWVEEMLPDLGVAQRQLNTAELLAGFQWGVLGEYGRDLSYAPDEVDDALKAFKEKLSDIGARIQKRNRVERESGLPVYDFLVPKNIPQSTNV